MINYLNHAIDKHQKCPYCDYQSPLVREWKRHIDRTHPEHDEKKFFCDKCEASFIFEVSLQQHMKESCKNSEDVEMIKAKRREKCLEIKTMKKWACSDCDKVYSAKKDLTNHVNSVHLKLKPYKCELCPSKFTQEFSLKVHIRNKHENSPKEYNCVQCEESFKNELYLENHVLSVHEKRFDYKCEHCGKDFAVLEMLKRHIRWYHELKNNTELKCDSCDKNMSNKLSLDRHKFYVHKEKPEEYWQCKECPNRKRKIFFSEAPYHRHMVSWHSGAPE